MTKSLSYPAPVKLFVGMLSQDTSLLDALKIQLENLYGPCDLEGPVWPWEHTEYYSGEMGNGLKRKFIFFEKLIDPASIADIKLRTGELEMQYLNEHAGRKINLDPGYLNTAKIVLASTKDFSHRIYLGKGIFGEVTLLYSGRNYQILPFTFPDYRTAEYLELFREVRGLFKKQMKYSS